MRGKEGNFTNPTKFLPLHFVKDKLLNLSYVCGQRVVADVDVFGKPVDDSAEWGRVEEGH